jgi:hypothetical protein
MEIIISMKCQKQNADVSNNKRVGEKCLFIIYSSSQRLCAGTKMRIVSVTPLSHACMQ